MLQIDDSTKTSLIDTALTLADVAREATLRHFRDGALSAENKDMAGFDPVTIADREAEEAMRSILAKMRPDDGIIGEEFGKTEGTSGLTWVLDPVDGTRGFLSGTPTWGVLIAVGDESGPRFGVVDQPYIGERFVGGFGEAYMTGPLGRRVLQTCAHRPLADAILFTTFPEVGSKIEGTAFHDLSQRVKLTRYGMDCYAYALVAAGQIDLVVEAGLNAYDIQGPMAVIEAAGGIVTDWKGGSAQDGGRVIAAANAEIHAEALKVLSLAPEG